MARRRRWAGEGGRIFMDRFTLEVQRLGNVADRFAPLPSGLNLGIALGPQGTAGRRFGRPRRRRRTGCDGYRGLTGGERWEAALKKSFEGVPKILQDVKAVGHGLGLRGPSRLALA